MKEITNFTEEMKEYQKMIDEAVEKNSVEKLEVDDKSPDFRMAALALQNLLDYDSRFVALAFAITVGYNNAKLEGFEDNFSNELLDAVDRIVAFHSQEIE